MADAAKALRIVAGSLKRTTKELAAYHKEKAAEEEKIESMKAAGADAHDIKQQQNVLGETLMMIPDCTTRLRGTLEHTEDTIAEHEGDVDAESEELAAAKEAVEAAKAALGDEEE
eukprot:PRCOL_00002235-RA